MLDKVSLVSNLRLPPTIFLGYQTSDRVADSAFAAALRRAVKYEQRACNVGTVRLW